jgi:hypothetical protein
MGRGLAVRAVRGSAATTSVYVGLAREVMDQELRRNAL